MFSGWVVATRHSVRNLAHARILHYKQGSPPGVWAACALCFSFYQVKAWKNASLPLTLIPSLIITTINTVTYICTAQRTFFSNAWYPCLKRTSFPWILRVMIGIKEVLNFYSCSIQMKHAMITIFSYGANRLCLEMLKFYSIIEITAHLHLVILLLIQALNSPHVCI
jgi:hypothetical protein